MGRTDLINELDKAIHECDTALIKACENELLSIALNDPVTIEKDDDFKILFDPIA